jgi:hypothetical protein
MAKVRDWMVANCPALLAELESLQAARRARRKAQGGGYHDADIRASEVACWMLVAQVPGWRELVGVSGPEVPQEGKENGNG